MCCVASQTNDDTGDTVLSHSRVFFLPRILPNIRDCTCENECDSKIVSIKCPFWLEFDWLLLLILSLSLSALLSRSVWVFFCAFARWLSGSRNYVLLIELDNVSAAQTNTVASLTVNMGLNVFAPTIAMFQLISWLHIFCIIALCLNHFV